MCMGTFSLHHFSAPLLVVVTVGSNQQRERQRSIGPSTAPGTIPPRPHTTSHPHRNERAWGRKHEACNHGEGSHEEGPMKRQTTLTPNRCTNRPDSSSRAATRGVIPPQKPHKTGKKPEIHSSTKLGDVRPSPEQCGRPITRRRCLLRP